MTDTIGAELEHDHERIDAHFAAFGASLAAGPPDAAALAAGAEGLRHHIWVEEEEHFPPLREGALTMPIMVMLREHGQLWDALDAIEAGVGAGEDVGEAWAGFIALLEAHNMKEERIVYPAGDEMLAVETTERVRRALASERPADWVCEMAGVFG